METLKYNKLSTLEGGNIKEFGDGVCKAVAVGGALEAAVVEISTGGLGTAVYGACAAWGIARIFW